MRREGMLREKFVIVCITTYAMPWLPMSNEHQRIVSYVFYFQQKQVRLRWSERVAGGCAWGRGGGIPKRCDDWNRISFSIYFI